MPNGGPNPDCLHCKWHTQSKCSLHSLNLFNPVYLFCADWESLLQENADWLTDQTNNVQLQSQTLYFWVAARAKKDGRNKIMGFTLHKVCSFLEFAELTEDDFWDQIRSLHAQ